MAMSGPTLATAIKGGLGFGAMANTAQLSGLAAAIVAHVQTGVVAFLPGTITGTAPPSGGPLIAGAGAGGTIVLVPTALESALVGVFGVSTPEILGMADAISLHVSTLGLVSFASGTITGACSNTPVAPGVLAGVGANGTISGLVAGTLATALAVGIGQPAPTSQLTNMATEIVNHIMNNAVVSLPVVTATCSAGGGPIIAGAAAGGIII